MTTRSDIVVDFFTSPRIAVVNAPSQEFIVQDIVDTLRRHEDMFRGNSEFKLLNASGKENLGGDVQVGITVELQDTQIAFEGRTSVDQTGTVTSPSGPPVGNSPSRINGLVTLTDDNASFITNGVTRGSLVINFTDQSIAEVYRVISETVLISKTPVNGIDNSFDTNDFYHIYNVDQCQVLGGNLVAVDANGDEISPIAPTAFTQIVRSLSTSATLIGGNNFFNDVAQNVWDYDASLAVDNSMGDIIRRTSYNDYIYLDESSGTAGQTYPKGTKQDPVNNMADALAIGIREGIFTIRVANTATALASDTLNGFTIEGSSPETTSITVASGASTSLVTFRELSITGSLNGRVFFDNCFVRDGVSNFQGTMQETLLGGVISLTGSTPVYFLSCYSDDTGSPLPEPIINFGGNGPDLIMREYSGEVRLINKTNDSRVSISFVSGNVTIDESVTGGIFNLQGVYGLDNQSSGSPGISLVQNTNLDTIEIKVDNVQDTTDAILVSVSNFGTVIDDLIKYQRNRSLIDPVNHTLTIFEDDGVTPLTIFQLYDENGVASCTSVFERVPVTGSP